MSTLSENNNIRVSFFGTSPSFLNRRRQKNSYQSDNPMDPMDPIINGGDDAKNTIP